MALIDGARNAVNVCMGVQKGETLLILNDTEKAEVGRALFMAGAEAGAEVMSLKMLPLNRPNEEPLEPVARLMSLVDVVIAPTKYSISQTAARVKANRSGTRVATMPGITESMLAEGGMTADFRYIEKSIKELYKKVRKRSKVTVETAAGSKLEFSIKGRDWITADTGICTEKGGFTTLPAGEIFIAPIEGTAQGVAVIDGSLGTKLDKHVTTKIERGVLQEIDFQRDIISEMFRIGEKARNLAEFGIGMNPRAKIVGHPLEDEKVLGTIHLAFGDNASFGGRVAVDFHLDAVIKDATVRLDDETILKDGLLKL